MKEKIEKIDSEKLDKISGGSKIGDYIDEKYRKFILKKGKGCKCKRCGVEYTLKDSIKDGDYYNSATFCPNCCREMSKFLTLPVSKFYELE